MGVPEREKEKEAERILGEIIVPKCPNLMKTINMHIQEAQQTQVELNSESTTHIILKLSKRQKES